MLKFPKYFSLSLSVPLYPIFHVFFKGTARYYRLRNGFGLVCGPGSGSLAVTGTEAYFV